MSAAYLANWTQVSNGYVDVLVLSAAAWSGALHALHYSARLPQSSHSAPRMVVQGSGSCSNAGRAAHGGSVTHAAQNQRRRQSRQTRQRQQSALLCARYLGSGSLTELLLSACMRQTASNTQVHRSSTCYHIIPGAPQSNVQGPPLYAIAITRPEDVQTGEAIAAADASTNGAPAAMEITTGDTSAELPAGELKWDPPSGEHTGHSELHMCQSQELRVARACEGAVPVAGT
jgi:hypothetical protein